MHNGHTFLGSSLEFVDPTAWVCYGGYVQNWNGEKEKPMINHGCPKSCDHHFWRNPCVSQLSPLQFLARLQIRRPTPSRFPQSWIPLWQNKNSGSANPKLSLEKTTSNRFDRNSSSIAASSTILSLRQSLGLTASRV